jgi:hypothetical protein
MSDGGHGRAHKPGEEYTLGDMHASAAGKDAYFARQQAEAYTRPLVSST